MTTRKDYAAFGEEIATAQRSSGLSYDSSETRKGYTGYEKDTESGLEFAQARYYNALHGRYTSIDPLTASANVKNPQTFNRYSYVLNSPYKFVDPLGLISSTTGANGGSAWCSTCETSDDDNGGFADDPPSLTRAYQSEADSTPAAATTTPEGAAQQQPAPATSPPAQTAEQNAETQSSVIEPGKIKVTRVEVFTEVPKPPEPIRDTGFVRPGTKPVSDSTSTDGQVNINAPSNEVFYIKVTATMDGDAVFTNLALPTIVQSSVDNAFQQTTFPGETVKEGEVLKPRTEISDDGKTITAIFAFKRANLSGKNTTFTVGFEGRSTQGAFESLLVNKPSDPRGKLMINVAVNPNAPKLP